MKKSCVLISGPTIASDLKLHNALHKCARVLKNCDSAQIESIIANQKVDLILLEVSKGHDSELALIRRINHTLPEIAIVVIDGNGNGDRDKLAQAFSYGAKDAFRKPYKRDLIVERVNALLRHPQYS